MLLPLGLYRIGVRDNEAVDVSCPQSDAVCSLCCLLGLPVRFSSLLQCLVLYALSEGEHVVGL